MNSIRTFRRSMIGTAPIDMDIELLLHWAAQKQCAFGSESTDPDSGGQGLGLGGGGHQDATALFNAVGRFDRITRDLVVACARSGLRPDWMEGKRPHFEPRYGWKRTRQGEIMRDVDGWRWPNVIERSEVLPYGGVRPIPPYVRIVLVDDERCIKGAQGRYMLWWNALRELRSTKLQQFRAIGPACDPTPWLVRNRIEIDPLTGAEKGTYNVIG